MTTTLALQEYCRQWKQVAFNDLARVLNTGARARLMQLKAIEAVQTGGIDMIGRPFHDCLLVAEDGGTSEAVEGSVPPHNVHKTLLEGVFGKEHAAVS
jgi:hypothetical protein